MLYYDEGQPASGQKVLLATTAYESPDAAYTFSIQGSREALHQAGIGTAYYLLCGNCHVDDARNQVVQAFFKTDCTDLVFLDADVSWEAKDLVRLCQHKLDVVGGVYPYRRNKPDEVPARLKLGAEVQDGLIEVDGLPTGFLRIKRRVLEAMAEDCEVFNTDDGPMHLMFQRTLIQGTRWGGDLDFCNRWRDRGGKIYCDLEAVLGHTGKTVIKGSLGSQLRKRNRQTLKHVCDKIREGTETLRDLEEAREYVGNHWGLDADALMLAVKFARQATGPILEAGSGLSTILMAAATEQTVFCLEHSAVHIPQLKDMAYRAEVPNIGLCVVPVHSGWYDVSDFKGLPDRFAFGLNDGPPREIGSRDGYFRAFGDRVDTILCDDADDPVYRQFINQWAAERDRSVYYHGTRTAVIQCRQPEALSLARSA